MNKHTPAPWHIAEYGENADGTPKFYAIKHGPDTLANLGTLGNNALLIAAAPELLDLLRAAIARIELANAEGNNILSAWLPDARAAIKAAGVE